MDPHFFWADYATVTVYYYYYLLFVENFVNVHFFHAKLWLEVSDILGPSTYPWKLPIWATEQAIPCHPSDIPKSLDVPAPTFRLNLIHICASLHSILLTVTFWMTKQSQSAMSHYISHYYEYPEGCTNPHCTFYPSRTPHIHFTIMGFFLSRLYRFSTFTSMFQSNISAHFGHKFCKSFHQLI